MIKRYNGTAWNAVTYCKNFNGTEQFTYFPVVANTFANAISSWTIKGNEQHTGTPAPGNPIRGVGEETANLFTKNGATDGKYIDASGNEQDSTSTIYQFAHTALLPINPSSEFTFSLVAQAKSAGTSHRIIGYDNNGDYIAELANLIVLVNEAGFKSVTFNTPANCHYFTINYVNTYYPNTADLNLMLNTGSTAQSYEPYGYKIPISSGNATTPVYISAPLRKSLDGTVFDTLDSTGLVTYNVDEYGAPLVTPTTATVTVPTITSALGRTVISFGTTIQPSEFDMTYHGWHSHIPSIRSNNA